MRRSAYYALGASWAECWAEVSRDGRTWDEYPITERTTHV